MKRLLATTGLLAMLVGQSPAQQVTVVPGHSLIGTQVFTSGTATFTPDPGTNSVIIEVQAPGGGGGGCGATGAGTACVGGSGGGGSYMKGFFTSGFAGITMTVGAPGAAGAVTPGAGGAGGVTSAGALISCPGGLGGPVGVTGAAASFTVVTGGSNTAVTCTNTGGTVLASVLGGFSGGGAQAATTIGAQFPGPGGNSILGIAAPAFTNVGSATSVGQAGKGFGWGAMGSYSDASQSATVGLAGGPGLIVVYEFN